LNRHARPNEHRCPAQNLGIGVIAFLHAWRLTPFRGGHNCAFPNRGISMRHIGGRKTVPPRFFGYTLFGQCQKGVYEWWPLVRERLSRRLNSSCERKTESTNREQPDVTRASTLICSPHATLRVGRG
jgi:hypothetical protein